MSPIKWTIRWATTDPGDLAKRLVARRPVEGVVFVHSPMRNAGVLRFSAVATCGRETPLFLGLTAAFSASEGIRKDTGIISWVRWPNSVTIEQKVVATTSALVTPAAGGAWVELDFWVNLSHTRVTGATSLYDALGVDVDERILMEKILESLSWMHSGWSKGMHPQILRRIRSMTETIGGKVTVRAAGKKTTGSGLDIDALGRLSVQLDGGGIAKLQAEDELLEP